MFKFLKFNNYTLDNLKKGQLWGNYYDFFNDPFECWCIEKTGIPDPDKEKERYDNIVATWGYDPGPYNREEYFEYCSEFDNPYSMKVSYYIESARISCFCKRPDNLLMWSHYADGLRGFCLEFDRSELLKPGSIDADVFDVMYTEKPPLVDTMLYEVAKDQFWYHEMAIGEENSKIQHIPDYAPDKLLPEYHAALKDARQLLFDLYFKILCYKPKEWQYEEEVRLIYHTDKKDKSGHPFKYPKSAIKSIIIGEKMQKSDFNKLIKILNKNEIEAPIKTAIRVKDSYKLMIE
jgi:hypothetical protein